MGWLRLRCDSGYAKLDEEIALRPAVHYQHACIFPAAFRYYLCIAERLRTLRSHIPSRVFAVVFEPSWPASCPFYRCRETVTSSRGLPVWLLSVLTCAPYFHIVSAVLSMCARMTRQAATQEAWAWTYGMLEHRGGTTHLPPVSHSPQDPTCAHEASLLQNIKAHAADHRAGNAQM